MNRGILIFTDSLPYGKSETFLETELAYIVDSFEIVSLIPFETGGDKSRRMIPEKVNVLEPPFIESKKKLYFLIKGTFNVSPFFIFLKEALSSKVWLSATNFRIWATHFLMIRSLLSYIKRRDLINYFNQFDLLYFYWGLRWSQVLPYLPSEIKAKIVVRFHGSDLYEHTNNGYIPWRREQLHRINKAVVISETGKAYIEKRYPFMQEKILISRLGTKDYGLNPFSKSDTIRIVSCSNLVAVKRIELIIETLTHMRSKVNWIHFGDGPGMKAIHRLAHRLPSNVTSDFRGAVDHIELMNYYKSVPVDLFINVSSSEGVPVSIMEVMSFGIPVIATNVGGTSEIVSDRTGMLIDPSFSPEELAGKIEALIRRNDITNIRTTTRNKWEQISEAENVYPGFIEELLRV